MVRIDAPMGDVMEYLVEDQNGEFGFYMPKLYPEKFAVDDWYGDEAWDRAWAIEHTGAENFPSIYSVEGDGKDHTWLGYDTA